VAVVQARVQEEGINQSFNRKTVMMRSFTISLGVTLMFFSSAGWAQGFVENALLFSRTKPGGSARIQAMGGAQIALGGDYSSALSNPAGLGMYNRSEITFSPALNFYSSDSEMIDHTGNNEATDSKTVFTVPGLSYVHHSPLDKGDFLGGSFAVSMSRTNDFQNTFRYGGTDNATSIIDYFEQMAHGYSINPLPECVDCNFDFDTRDTPLLNYDSPEGLGYLTFLINPNSETDPYPDPFTRNDYDAYTTYFSELDTLGTDETRTQNRQGNVNLRGAQYQWSFAYGGNYKDKLFLGASVGLTTLRYKYSSSYSESNFSYSSDYESPLDDLNLNESIEIDGSGVNLTLGLIYRFVDFAQVGVSFVTPTYYVLSDTYSAQLRANWNIRADQDESSEPIISEYNLTTPMKLSTGLAFFLGKYGLISGDLEFVNYGKSKYNSDTPGVSFQLDNDDIKYYYTNVVNYRFGAESRLGIYRLRAGYSFQDSAYKSNFEVDGNITTFSAGAGVKLEKFFLDATWLNTNYNSTYSPYSVQDANDNTVGPLVSVKNTVNSVMLTVGFSF
jgi:hypothetical protein